MATRLRRLALPVIAIAAIAGSGTPASAFADVATGPGITAACALNGGAITGPGITFVVSGNATASGVALATHVHCTVRTNSGSYGGPSADLFGPAAVAAGLSQSVPLGNLAGLRVCAYGTAFFQGGVVRSTTPSAGC